LVLPTFQAENAEELTSFVSRVSSYLSSEQDKEHGANCLESVFECSRTTYNPDGAKLGRPSYAGIKHARHFSAGGFSERQRRWKAPAIEELCMLTVKAPFLNKLEVGSSTSYLRSYVRIFSPEDVDHPVVEPRDRVALA